MLSYVPQAAKMLMASHADPVHTGCLGAIPLNVCAQKDLNLILLKLFWCD